jgi:hypothetical protein
VCFVFSSPRTKKKLQWDFFVTEFLFKYFLFLCVCVFWSCV